MLASLISGARLSNQKKTAVPVEATAVPVESVGCL